MTSDTREEFARLVWAEFQRASGSAREMSSAEWHVLCGWMDREIPFAVVRRAFREFNGAPRRLEAMQGPVDRAYRYNRQAVL